MEDMLGEEAKIGFSSKVVGVLTSRAVIVTLAMGALAAASLEVIEDSKPGGHHGAVEAVEGAVEQAGLGA